jgi:hypothetical protein
MSPDTAKRLALVFPTAFGQETGVAGVAGVADETRYASTMSAVAASGVARRRPAAGALCQTRVRLAFFTRP